MTLLNLLVNLLFQLLSFFYVGPVNGINARHLVDRFCEIAVGRILIKVAAALIVQLDCRTTIGTVVATRKLIFDATHWRRDTRIVKRLIIQRDCRYFQLTAAYTHFLLRVRGGTQVRVLLDLLIRVEQIIQTCTTTGSLAGPSLGRTDRVQVERIC